MRFIIDDFGTDDVFELCVLSYSWLGSYPFHTLCKASELTFKAYEFDFYNFFELLGSISRLEPKLLDSFEPASYNLAPPCCNCFQHEYL